jgi:hypothetical protein
VQRDAQTPQLYDLARPAAIDAAGADHMTAHRPERGYSPPDFLVEFSLVHHRSPKIVLVSSLLQGKRHRALRLTASGRAENLNVEEGEAVPFVCLFLPCQFSRFTVHGMVPKYRVSRYVTQIREKALDFVTRS